MEGKPKMLPTDEVIFERSKLWATFFADIVGRENFKEVDFDDITSHDEDEIEDEDDIETDPSDADVNNKNPIRNCKALVRVNNFEGSVSSDDYDMDNLLNATLPEVEERKRIWKASGMDKVLDTFDLNAITDKFGSWLKAVKQQEKANISNSSLEDAHIMHFENHHFQLNSNDSLQSADTTKYVLSNRKSRAASCTTMTIKKFRYVKGKRREKSESDVNQNLDDVFKRKCSELQSAFKYRPVCHAINEEPAVSRLETKAIGKVRRNSLKENLKESLNKVSLNLKHDRLGRQESRHKKRRSEIARKRSDSSSSSSESTSNCNNVHAKPKFRRINRRLKPLNESRPLVDLTSLATTSSGSNHSPKRIVPPTKTKEIKLASSANVNGIQNSNTTCFLPENIANSTALLDTKTDGQVNAKNCQLSPVHVKANDIPDTVNLDRKVLIYTPPNRPNSRACFELSEEHLRKSIGQKAARRFIKFNERQFPFKFNSSSFVYFKLPPESENSHQSGTNDDSEEDILDMFGKQGELVEQPTPQI